MEQLKPQEIFRTGRTVLIEGLAVRFDPLIISTIMSNVALGCCKNTDPDKLESELLKTAELDILTIETSFVPIAPPPHAGTRKENVSSTLQEETLLLCKVTDFDA